MEPRQHVPHVPREKTRVGKGFLRKPAVPVLPDCYLRGSWECISMGLGVPPGPPRVRASMNPRTTVLLLAVPNSSREYLQDTGYLETAVFLNS